MASKTPLYILRGTVLYVTVGTDILCNYRQMYYIMLIYIYIYTHMFFILRPTYPTSVPW